MKISARERVEARPGKYRSNSSLARISRAMSVYGESKSGKDDPEVYCVCVYAIRTKVECPRRYTSKDGTNGFHVVELEDKRKIAKELEGEYEPYKHRQVQHPTT